MFINVHLLMFNVESEYNATAEYSLTLVEFRDSKYDRKILTLTTALR